MNIGVKNRRMSILRVHCSDALSIFQANCLQYLGGSSQDVLTQLPLLFLLPKITDRLSIIADELQYVTVIAINHRRGRCDHIDTSICDIIAALHSMCRICHSIVHVNPGVAGKFLFDINKYGNMQLLFMMEFGQKAEDEQNKDRIPAGGRNHIPLPLFEEVACGL